MCDSDFNVKSMNPESSAVGCSGLVRGRLKCVCVVYNLRKNHYRPTVTFPHFINPMSSPTTFKLRLDSLHIYKHF